MTNLEKFRKLLEELFQLDQADLDFGIYRIMNQKRDEVIRFLDNDLLPQVKKAFREYQPADTAAIQKKLETAIEQATSLGVDPETTTKVKELRAQMANSSVDVTALENEVFSHLFNFFRRYYHEGDFISLRRYKEGVYAIPYEGEEVKLHWANHDQYYVKSSEYFRDYIFTMPSGKRVRVHLVAASTEQDNKKEQAGKERRFVICEEDPIYEENGELFIRFEYKSDNGKKKQDALNQEAIERVLKSEGFEEWTQELSKPAPTKANPKRTVLEKHLTQYTARNTFDYFIHKDLGGFLRRELDFYIKNEVMHLDDIEHDTLPRVEQYLSKIKVIRKIAHKIIQFLEQLENFQKKLWLKKKFVVETNYCITLDRVPEELYPEIAANDAQREEWVRLFAIDKIEKDLNGPGYTTPISPDFLKQVPKIALNTMHFSDDFHFRLLSSIDNLAEMCDGILVNSENAHALSLLENRFRNSVSCVYIDPPYNTGSDEFHYKDGYQSSSWLSALESRCSLARSLMSSNALFFLQIGDDEAARSRLLLEGVFAERKNSAVVRRGVKNVQAQFADIDRLSEGHDIIHVFACQSGIRVPHLRHRLNDENPGKWDTFWRGVDRPTMRYELLGHNPTSGQWRWEENRAKQAVENYKQYLDEESEQKSLDEWYAERLQAGETLNFVRLNEDDVVQYYVPPQAYRLVSDNWLDIASSGKVTGLPHEKGLDLLRRVIGWNSQENEYVLDFFAGSGSTGHAALQLGRKFILIEMGSHFDEVLLPRLLKAAYEQGQSICYSCATLESYEDTLNNLELKRTGQQASLLEQDDDLREQYVLSYMLDVESRGSQSLLNVESFRNPDEYKLRVERNGETQLVNVDLVETFNWLLGLTVKHIDVIRGVRVVEGTNPDGERTLVLWRNLDETDNDALDEWFKKQDYNTKDQEYDLIYVNGDNNLENLRRGDQTWKVRLIEEEFGRLMFDVEDV